LIYRYVSTPILGGGDPEAAAAIKSKILPTIPMGRLGEVDEVYANLPRVKFYALTLQIADCAVFLSSHMASYINGAALVADGFVRTSPGLKPSF